MKNTCITCLWADCTVGGLAMTNLVLFVPSGNIPMSIDHQQQTAKDYRVCHEIAWHCHQPTCNDVETKHFTTNCDLTCPVWDVLTSLITVQQWAPQWRQSARPACNQRQCYVHDTQTCPDARNQRTLFLSLSTVFLHTHTQTDRHVETHFSIL